MLVYVVYTKKIHDFRKPVEGGMKLSRACFSNFEYTFPLARFNVGNCPKRKYKHIIMCIGCVFKYSWYFRNFAEGAASQTMQNGVKNSISPKCGQSGHHITRVTNIISSKYRHRIILMHIGCIYKYICDF